MGFDSVSRRGARVVVLGALLVCAVVYDCARDMDLSDPPRWFGTLILGLMVIIIMTARKTDRPRG